MLEDMGGKEAIEGTDERARKVIHIPDGIDTKFLVRISSARPADLKCGHVKAGPGELITSIAPRTAVVKDLRTGRQSQRLQGIDVVGIVLFSAGEVRVRELCKLRV